MKSQNKYSFVVPAFNEEANIIVLYDRIKNLVSKYDSGWELIFVDDGSTDKTTDILYELSQKDKQVKYIELSRNFGHQAALSAGLRYAKGDAIISLDCDLQDPPEVIEQMIDEWKKGMKLCMPEE
jgi:glycosyltransferase involved in cell wall biosynthesis